jgi:hypothetical protein
MWGWIPKGEAIVTLGPKEGPANLASAIASPEDTILAPTFRSNPIAYVALLEIC